jgi:beta-xylosidase
MPMTYQNPVWPGYFADPFVLRSGGVYFAYGTGEGLAESLAGEPCAFAILRSTDLAHWEPAGAALKLDPAGARSRAYWAPEVAAEANQFFLYYSSAPEDRDELHRLHVAIADQPTGPFIDAGPVLPESEGFCIDAHPFRDPETGRWHLFFAKDFFEQRTGTGLAVVPLTSDMRRAAGPSRLVLQANADWQIYQRNRPLYGRQWTAWHTVEGPCVVARGGRYYCFYSGGNWRTDDYGVSYAVADEPLGPYVHAPENGPVVLRGRAGEVLGPGHNSHATGPDGTTEFLVYHAWDVQRKVRRMSIDRLIWTSKGPRCEGPTTTPQTLGERI